MTKEFLCAGDELSDLVKRLCEKGKHKEAEEANEKFSNLCSAGERIYPISPRFQLEAYKRFMDEGITAIKKEYDS